MNSKLMEHIYRMINPEEGEALAQVKKSHLTSLPIPKPTKKNLDLLEEIAKLVEKIIDIAPNKDKKSKDILGQIEDLVEQLYLDSMSFTRESK